MEEANLLCFLCAWEIDFLKLEACITCKTLSAMSPRCNATEAQTAVFPERIECVHHAKCDCEYDIGGGVLL